MIVLALLLVLGLAPVADLSAQEAVIKIEPMSPEQLLELGLTLYPTSGLQVIPKEGMAFLSVSEAEGEEILSVEWSLASVPGGSVAVLDSTTTLMTTFRSDLSGEYVIGVEITTASGTADASVTLYAGTYTGVGGVGGVPADISQGQCAACHNGVVQPDKFTDWMETGHATKFARAIDGIDHTFYAESCIKCHTSGFDTLAVNNGFDDQMAATGWTFPAVREPGNWDNLVTNYPQLAQSAVIGCESCHGPGGQHYGVSDKIGKSLEVGVCAQCHDELPYHTVVPMWKNAKHSEMITYPQSIGTCVPCHTGSGFVERFKDPDLVEFEGNLTCGSCHDPHSAANEHQLRIVTADTLNNGSPIEQGGIGQLCMNCHKSRRNAEEYAIEYHDHFGPHGNPQADMFLGDNAVEFGQDLPSSAHKFALEEGCVSCHMYDTPEDGEPGYLEIGGHTWKMHWDADTPGDPDDDVENVTACASCHGPLDSFDDVRAAWDYDGDGTIEGVQSEVQGMLTNLALLLPPVGVDEVTVDSNYTVRQLQAAYNYLFVVNDGSFGVHNAKYAVNLLGYSTSIITGVPWNPQDEVPVSYALEQNYPNPFNPLTNISFSLPKQEHVRLDVYDILGGHVTTLVNEQRMPGNYQVTWGGTGENGVPVASGVYLYKIQAGKYTLTKKMVLLK